MMRLPGALCTLGLGPDWIDRGTTATTRNFAPAHREAPPRPRPQAAPQVLSEAERDVLQALDAAGILDLNERAMVLAQLAHESMGFARLHENLNYSAARLRQVFPGRFRTDQSAREAVAGGAAAIAERIYGGRADLGNTQAGDGARYVGRGYVHLTGRANYDAAGRALGLDLLNHPELAVQREHAARIALWFWSTHRAGAAARRGDVQTVTEIINGGLNGLADRQRRYRRYRDLLRRQHEANEPREAPAIAPAPSVPTLQLGPLG